MVELNERFIYMLKLIWSKLVGVKRTMPNINVANSTMTPTKTWLVGRLDTPTVDFYFRSRYENQVDFYEVDIHELDDDTHPFWLGNYDRVVLVRDVPINLLIKLKTSCHKRQVIWFIDDDIPSVVDDHTLPKAYRRRLSSWFNQAHNMLSQICSDIWVSTPYLAQRYQLPNSCILPPLQISRMKPAIVKCFYHGSASHTLEWKFIVELIQKIQSKHTNVSFELIGDHSLYKQVKHIPRVTVLHPMSWGNYQAHISSRTMDIGLAPLFTSPFNLARSHCKLLDIQRQGAVGIYSIRFPRADSIRRLKAGWLAEDNVQSWLDAFEDAIYSDRMLINENSRHLIEQEI